MPEEEKEHLPEEVAEEFFAKKEEMKKEKEEKERQAAEKRAKISETLEKHIEEKSEKGPPE
ncbi:MAG: hypothetical protein ACE5R6_05320 [Candidatus Heimdallarchaeota archaeon]